MEFKYKPLRDRLNHRAYVVKNRTDPCRYKRRLGLFFMFSFTSAPRRNRQFTD